VRITRAQTLQEYLDGGGRLDKQVYRSSLIWSVMGTAAPIRPRTLPGKTHDKPDKVDKRLFFVQFVWFVDFVVCRNQIERK